MLLIIKTITAIRLLYVVELNTYLYLKKIKIILSNLAAMRGHEDIVKLLLINNSYKNIQSLDGSTAQTYGKL
jgi:ankyrin repeat protein